MKTLQMHLGMVCGLSSVGNLTQWLARPWGLCRFSVIQPMVKNNRLVLSLLFFFGIAVTRVSVLNDLLILAPHTFESIVYILCESESWHHEVLGVEKKQCLEQPETWAFSLYDAILIP